MIGKLKKEAMQRGMKLLTNPKVMKVMADPRFMNAIMKGMEIKGRLQSDLEGWVRSMAQSLNLATKDDLANIEQSVQRVEARVDEHLTDERAASAKEAS